MRSMARRALGSAFVLFCFCTVAALAQAGQSNPFIKSETPHQVSSTTIAPDSSASQSLETVSQPSFGTWVMGKFVDIQRGLNELIANLVRRVQPGNSTFDVAALLSLLGLSFFYGIFHALGPGHGKAIASTFFLTRPARIRHGIELGYWLALIHAIVAIGIVFLLSSVLKLSINAGTDVFSWWLGTISYSLVIVIGVYMLTDIVVQIATHGRVHLHFHLHVGGDHDHGHDHSHEHHHHEHHDHHHEHSHAPDHGASLHHEPYEHSHQHGHDHDHEHFDEHQHDHPHEIPDQHVKMVTSRELMLLGFLSAIIPCPGAIGIMVFATGAGAAFVGAMAVVALSLGMGITSSVAGITGILARRGVLKAGQKAMPAGLQTIGSVVRVIGSVIFTFLGVALLIGQF